MLIWTGTAVFVGLAAASAARAMHLNRRFQHHLEEHHHEQWKRIYQDELVKKALLWPFKRGTPVDLLWNSQETFGDARITDFRRGIRQSFLGAISAGIAAVVWFGVGVMILESLSRR
jgi:hypothetical protein